MKIFYYILLFSFAIPLNSFAQLQSVSFYGNYSTSTSTRLQVTDADAVGGGAKIKFVLAGNLGISVDAGYKLYSLSEPDVLNNWDWTFWTERYYPKIVSDVNADPNLSVILSPFQKMDLIPLSIKFSYDFFPLENFEIVPSVGGGVFFYNRRMYAVENWSKYFPASDYTLSYSYRNIAPTKSGNPFFVNGDLSIQYNLFNIFSVFTTAQYNYVIPTEGSFGYDDFPISSEFSINLGIVIYY